EAHMLGLVRSWFRSSPKLKLHEEPDVTYCVSSIPHPLFNGVARTEFAATLSNEEIDARIQAVLRPFQSRPVPFLWTVSPWTCPADLGARLETHGLVKVDQAPGMALDLETARLDVASPPGLTIDQVRDFAGVQQFAHLLGSAAEAPGDLVPDIAAIF